MVVSTIAPAICAWIMLYARKMNKTVQNLNMFESIIVDTVDLWSQNINKNDLPCCVRQYTVGSFW